MTPGDDAGEVPELRVTDRRRFTETGDVRPESSGDRAGGSLGDVSGAPKRASAESTSSAVPPAPDEEAPAGGFVGHGAVLGLGIEAVFYILWQSAMIALGAPDASGAPGSVDLPEARQAVALLKAVEEKTAGNLTPEESETLANLLHEAQLRYVQVARAMSGGRA